MHESCKLEIDKAAISLSGKSALLADRAPIGHVNAYIGSCVYYSRIGIAATALLLMTASPLVSAQTLEIGLNGVRMHQTDRVGPRT